VSEALALHAEAHEALRRWLHARSSIELGPEKLAVAEARLHPLLRRRGLEGLQGLAAALQGGEDLGLGAEVLEALTRGDTSFFRDHAQFEHLRQAVLPALRYRNPTRGVRIWSAGCSTGQEPYSLAMVLHKSWGAAWRTRAAILATDVSSRQLAYAIEGLYSREEVNRGLPISLLAQFFEQRGLRWQVAPDLKEGITFSARRLDVEDEPAEGFDLILLRHVLPCFGPGTREAVLRRLARALRPGGVLVLGMNEAWDLPAGLAPVGPPGMGCAEKLAA